MHVTIDRLSKRFGSHAALDAVSLQVAPGQIAAILGPNGAGKTTLLRCLATVASPSQGEIRCDGELLRRDRLDLRRRLFFLPDLPSVFPEMTLIQHVGMVLRIYEADQTHVEDRVLDLLREFDLLPLAETELARLSRGQLYKAALVALLSVDAELWMFDEPFASGMDPQGLSALRRHAREAAARGRTVLYTTQILEVAERFSDRVCILHRGRVRAFDALDQLRGQQPEADGVLEAIFAELHGEQP